MNVFLKVFLFVFLIETQRGRTRRKKKDGEIENKKTKRGRKFNIFGNILINGLRENSLTGG